MGDAARVIVLSEEQLTQLVRDVVKLALAEAPTPALLTHEEEAARLDAVMRSVVGHSPETSARYGDAKVISFAAEVGRVVMRSAGGTSGGDESARGAGKPAK